MAVFLILSLSKLFYHVVYPGAVITAGVPGAAGFVGFKLKL